MGSERYIRQIQFEPIGIEGQRCLALARVAIVGQGALGCASSDYLARAGVGFLRLIDSDRVDLSNLQRQILFAEADIGKNKAQAAAARLAEINSEIQIEAITERLNDENALDLLADLDLVIDASDNFEARDAINSLCLDCGIPWIYGGVVASVGMTMSFLPGGPCLHCVTGERLPERGEYPVAATAGILGMLPALLAAIQCCEAIKLLTGSGEARRTLLSLDIWKNTCEEFSLKRDESCRACSRAR